METRPIIGAGTVSRVQEITKDIFYLGEDDRRLALFENTHPIPKGMAYNSYLLLDEKVVLLDGIDQAVQDSFFSNLLTKLEGRELDYIIVQHVEPDHCASLRELFQWYKNAKIVCTKAALPLIEQFIGLDVLQRAVIIKDGFTLTTGKHTLHFFSAPMVHWPEVMVTYDSYAKVLFSADAFGSFGAQNGNLFADCVNYECEYLPEARRYYSNIVGKYGKQVAMLFAKLSKLDIQYICSLHGLVWRKDLDFILQKYQKWANYLPEEEKSVAIFYGSIYGGTERAAAILASLLADRGIRNVAVYDVSKTHVSELIAEVFRVQHVVFASATYNLGIFSPMYSFMHELAAHNVQKRTYSLIENGSWMPAAAKEMSALLDGMQDMRRVGDVLTVKSRVTEESYRRIIAMADAICEELNK